MGMTLATASGCAPPCHDDGWFQGGCPDPSEETDSAGEGGSGDGAASGAATTGDGSGDAGASTAGDGADDDSGGLTCPGVDATFVSPTPTFHFLIDQGTAMASELDGASRWDSTEAALLDPASGVVAPRDATTRFGLMLFRGLQAGCPSMVSTPAQLGAAGSMGMLMSMEAPAGHSPVADAVTVAVAEITADAADGPVTLVLVTAGEPSTCATPSPIGAQLEATRQAAIGALTTAYEAGIPSVVLAVGDDLPGEYLQALANAGAGVQPGDPDAEALVALDEATLVDALEQALSIEPHCDFELDAPVPAEAAVGCEVLVGGMPVPPSDADGWSLDDPQLLVLHGSACEALAIPQTAVELTCDCDV
ncbi:MAG: hypothetical protein KC501_20035 [Myxococcales bacterium]|nr:hypothetical protein [Myxococcales bacterium]